MKITWPLMWLNVSIATLNAELQLLVLYRLHVFLHTFSPTRIFKKIENCCLSVYTKHPLIFLFYLFLLLFMSSIALFGIICMSQCTISTNF